MILSEVRNYLAGRGQATLADIALHFDTEPAAMRGMHARHARPVGAQGKSGIAQNGGRLRHRLQPLRSGGAGALRLAGVTSG